MNQLISFFSDGKVKQPKQLLYGVCCTTAFHGLEQALKTPGYAFSKLPAAFKETLSQLKSEDTFGIRNDLIPMRRDSKPATTRVFRLK